LNALRSFELVLLATAFFVAVSIDYVLLHELFAYILVGDFTAEGSLSTDILAGTGVVSVFAFHALSGHSARFEGFIASLARIALALFLVGVGLMLAGMVHVSGAESLTTVSSSGLSQWLNNTSEDIAPPWLRAAFERYLLPAFPLVFAIGLGGCFCLSVYAAHIMLGGCSLRLRSIVETASIAKQSASILKQLKELEAKHVRLFQALAARTETKEDAICRYARTICAVGLQALLPFEEAVSNVKLNRQNTEPLGRILLEDAESLSANLQNLNLNELEARVNSIREAFKYETVLEIARKTSF